jgi:hypothetical protein
MSRLIAVSFFRPLAAIGRRIFQKPCRAHRQPKTDGSIPMVETIHVLLPAQEAGNVR